MFACQELVLSQSHICLGARLGPSMRVEKHSGGVKQVPSIQRVQRGSATRSDHSQRECSAQASPTASSCGSSRSIRSCAQHTVKRTLHQLEESISPLFAFLPRSLAEGSLTNIHHGCFLCTAAGSGRPLRELLPSVAPVVEA